jgi:predicted transglutaminase-like cysteine proteinase
MLARYESGAQDCAHWPCTHAGWKNTVATLRLLPALQQLREVNTRMNAHPYIPDYTGWGVEDFWETPFEFLKKSGDCEDYAIAKYLLLRAIGWPADRLRIAIVRDRNLNIGHAVLIAYLEGVTFVLDNQTGQILPEAQVHQYLPIYSVNEEGWWLHRL